MVSTEWPEMICAMNKLATARMPLKSKTIELHDCTYKKIAET